MKFSAALIITATSAVLAAPVPEDPKPTVTVADPAGVDAYTNYGDYSYKEYGAYGNYGNYGNPTPPAPSPPQPTSYAAYASYGTYKRALDWIKAKLD